MGLRIGSGFKVIRGVSARVVPVVYKPEYGDPAGSVYFGWETVPLTTTDTSIVIKDTNTRQLVDPGIILLDKEVVSFSDTSIVIKDTNTRQLVDPGIILLDKEVVSFSDNGIVIKDTITRTLVYSGIILPNNDGVIYSDNISIT